MSDAGEPIEVTTISMRAEAWVSVDALAQASGVSRASLGRLMRLGIVEPDDPQGRAFSAARVRHLRRVLRLRRDLGLDLIGAAVVADLIERVEALESELRGRR